MDIESAIIEGSSSEEVYRPIIQFVKEASEMVPAPSSSSHSTAYQGEHPIREEWMRALEPVRSAASTRGSSSGAEHIERSA